MPGPKRGYTTPHRCATVDSSRRNQPSDRDRQARQKLQEKTSDFQVTFDDCVFKHWIRGQKGHLQYI